MLPGKPQLVVLKTHTEQTSLCLTLSETPNSRFLATRLFTYISETDKLQKAYSSSLDILLQERSLKNELIYFNTPMQYSDFTATSFCFVCFFKQQRSKTGAGIDRGL